MPDSVKEMRKSLADLAAGFFLLATVLSLGRVMSDAVTSGKQKRQLLAVHQASSPCPRLLAPNSRQKQIHTNSASPRPPGGHVGKGESNPGAQYRPYRFLAAKAGEATGA
ncbi:hypothetical protein BaRGS_00018081 [Batillaria attramentaria]|uniref:Uncharacterized protein n=1 Tax=Batillaria attramentaria TaxID=370345 RepID=A0ABD0KTY9_9CAEN